jgi:RNA polymerase sigma-70 factor (ECF subfamily)
MRDTSVIDRLWAIIQCCSTSSDPTTQIARGLRVCGLSDEDIASRFPSRSVDIERLEHLDEQRESSTISRPLHLTAADRRLPAIRDTIYLLFTTGYGSSSAVGDHNCDEAIVLARTLRSMLLATDEGVESLLALMLLHHARRSTKKDAKGELVLLANQDRSRWDRTLIAEGLSLLSARRLTEISDPFALQARIAAVHATSASAEHTDWRSIRDLYERLYAVQPSPIVALNHAVAVSMLDGAAASLTLVDALADQLGEYHLWHATRADLLRRLARRAEAKAAYQAAHALTSDVAERRFLERRIAEVSSS